MARRTLRRSLVVTLFVALSLLMFSLGAFAFHDFTDVDTAAFYHDDVHWLKEMGITLGCGGTLFCPDGPVTRGQMAAFLHRASRVHELPGFALTTLDSTGNVGLYTSLAVGVDCRPLISYFDSTNGDLKVAHCGNTACTAATIITLDSGGLGNVGLYTSIAIGPDGLGLISYYDATNGNLKVAQCGNTTCSAAAATPTTVDSTGVVGLYTSIAIGPDGLGLISYYDFTNGDLKVAHCNDGACSAATITTLDSAGVVGSYTSITVGADSLGLISYYDSTNGNLKVAHCSNAICGAATLAIDSVGFVGYYTSIAIGPDGFGVISYYDAANGDLKVAHCSNA